MDFSTYILIFAGLAALICVVGMIRNWNEPSDGLDPHVHITLVGWLLAVLGAGVAITIIYLIWKSDWLPNHRLLRRGAITMMVVAGALLGTMFYFLGAWVCHRLGLRAWIVQHPRAETKPPRQLRYRLEDQDQQK